MALRRRVANNRLPNPFLCALCAGLLLLAGCPDDSAPGEQPGGDTSTLDSGGSGEIFVAEDAGGGGDAGTTTGQEDTGQDIVDEDAGKLWPEFFGEDCASNDDCVDDQGNSGWCVQTPEGEQKCTVDCFDECPSGHSCVTIQNAGSSDGLIVCMPNKPIACLACTEDANCIYQGARCLEVGFDKGEADMRCAPSCADDPGVCGEGYDCVLIDADPEGEAEPLCVPATKSCVCFGEDEQGNEINGSARTCQKSNEIGTCTGTEICDGENGWSGCTAADPSEEICDGEDNDCDGTSDEGVVTEACTVDNEWGSCAGNENCEGADGLVCDAATPAEEICDGKDNNCDEAVDEGMPDADSDGECDDLDTDDDNDGKDDTEDNCPFTANPDQKDSDNDGVGDACEDDCDNDGVPDLDPAGQTLDNCQCTPNPLQEDLDADLIGDACDSDADGDLHNAGEGSDCNDKDPTVYNGAEEICDNKDNDCNALIDEGFADSDQDGAKDCVDKDDDNDSFPDECPPLDELCVVDCAPKDAAVNPDALEICDGIDNNCVDGIDEGFDDFDEDDIADCVDPDIDGDDIPNDEDNCVNQPNPAQLNNDNDGQGDKCDTDDDNDGVLDEGDAPDNCPFDKNEDQTDLDGDGIGDACDADKDGDGVKKDDGDCVDEDEAIHPGHAEDCDGKDNNCNDLIDEGFTDTDNDALKDCVDPDDDNDGDEDLLDCAPLDATINSIAEELCDAKDNNCNNKIDEDCPPTSVDVIFVNAVVTGTTESGLEAMMSIGMPSVVGPATPADPDKFAVDFGFYYTLP